MVPKRAILLNPRRSLLHRRADEAGSPRAPVACNSEQAGALKYAYVLGHGRKGHRELTGQRLDRFVSAQKAEEDFSPRGVGERAECRVEGSRKVNHSVYLTTGEATSQLRRRS